MMTVIESHERKPRQKSQYFQPRRDLDSERAVLGAMLLSNEVTLPELLNIVQVSDFQTRDHRVIRMAIGDLYSQGLPVYSGAVAMLMAREGIELQAGDADEYLTELTLGTMLSRASARRSAELVKECATLTRVAEAANAVGRMVELAEDGEADAVLQAARRLVWSTTQAGDGEPRHASRLVSAAVEHMRRRATGHPDPRAVLTGFQQWDEIGGLGAGQLIVIASRPGVGRSTLLSSLTRAAVLKDGKRALYFSDDGPDYHPLLRILASEARVLIGRLTHGPASPEELLRVEHAATVLGGSHLYFERSSALTVDQVVSSARQLHNESGLDLILVDDLAALIPTGRTDLGSTQASCARQLKLLAEELNLPIVMTCPLSRRSENRPRRRPLLGDILGGVELEYVADLVLLLYRPEQYNLDDRPGEIEMMIAKNRHGHTRLIRAAFQGHYSRIVELSR